MAGSPPQAPAPVSAQHLLLYDGVCGFCNRLTTFVLARDADGVFAFAPLQSDTGRKALARFGVDHAALDTMYVISGFQSAAPKLLQKSDAALFVLGQLAGIWRFAWSLLALPSAFRDAIYDIVARYRYRLFGRYDSCPLPPPEHRRRFIDS